MIKMIWCEDKNHGIGIDNSLAWNIKSEMQHFRNETKGKTVVCGEKTFISFGNKPLPNRKNIVLTLDKNFIAPGAIIYNDLHQLLADYKDETIYIIGGKTIYKLLFPYADELIISTLNKSYNCNVFMSFDLSDFKLEKTLNNDEFVVNYYKRVKNAK